MTLFSPATIFLYLLGINALTMLVYWMDKRASRNSGAWRTPEATLLMFALLGGSPAAWYAQRRFRHKTRKTSFRMRFWAIIALQLATLGYYFFWQ